MSLRLATWAALPAVLLLLPGCGAPRAITTSAVARVPFTAGSGDAVFARAVAKMRAAGYDVQSCDAERWLLETSQLELDAPCGRTTCLARQRIEVKLGYRVVRVKVDREVYDGAQRIWQESDAIVAADAARVLAANIAGDAAPRRSAAREPQDPCVPESRVDVSVAPTAR